LDEGAGLVHGREWVRFAAAEAAFLRAEKATLQRFDRLLDKAREVKETEHEGYMSISYDQALLHEWFVASLTLMRSVFGVDSVEYEQFKSSYEGRTYSETTRFNKCLGALRAARESYEQGYNFRLQSLVRADVLDDVLEQAEELLDKGYKDPACMLARVALEQALKDLCTRHQIQQAKLDKMNADLAGAGVYNKTKQKDVTAWAGRGNDAAHGDFDNYSADDVRDMLDGVRRFIGDYL
jgi:hypothetical protein